MTDRHAQALALIEREDYVPAWLIVSELLNEIPDDPKALYLAGCLLRGQGHIGMALQLFRRSLGILSEHKICIPNVWVHYGMSLHDTHSYDEARAAFKMAADALKDNPSPTAAQLLLQSVANTAATYVQEGKAVEAVEWADKALAVDPTNRIARVAKAFGSLSQGQWATGWKYADALYGESIRIRVYCDPEEPVWDGSQGKTVVVQADQGLGEMIMFSQILPQMARDCKKVIVETNERLVPLFKRNFKGLDVYGTLNEKSGLEWPRKYAIDAHTHMSWLGTWYRKTDADFPRKPYIVPHAAKAAKWRKWLEQYPRPWVGLAWRGGIQRTNEAVRSIELERFAPLIQRGGSFISLAYQSLGREIAKWNIRHREQIHVPDIDNDGDFDEWVALISQLDHTVTVLTTVLHVCGALGKSCSVLVPTVCQWQHGYGGREMMWYAPRTICNYRQKTAGDWDSVIAEIAGDYEAFVLPLKAA